MVNLISDRCWLRVAICPSLYWVKMWRICSQCPCRNFNLFVEIFSILSVCPKSGHLSIQFQCFSPPLLRKCFIWNTLCNALYMFQPSLVAQRLKHLPAMWETWVQSLGWEDPLEKEMATHSSILACKIPWTEEPSGLQSTGSQRVGHDWVT